MVIVAAALLLSGCFIEPDDAAIGADFSVYGRESEVVLRTDAFIRAAAPGASLTVAPANFDRAARGLGLDNGAELATVLSGDCLPKGDLGRFAAARGLTTATAGLYLERRFGARLCPGATQ
jgi:hypothetical protein